MTIIKSDEKLILEKNGKLEICFVKSKDNFRWPQLFEGDDKEGEELFDPKLVEEIHNRLAHLTSDQWVINYFIYLFLTLLKKTLNLVYIS